MSKKDFALCKGNFHAFLYEKELDFSRNNSKMMNIERFKRFNCSLNPLTTKNSSLWEDFVESKRQNLKEPAMIRLFFKTFIKDSSTKTTT